MKINLSEYQSKSSYIFSGRTNGTNARKGAKLSKLEEDESVIEIIVPEETITITSSFFLGMFGDSVRKLTRTGFLKKFTFKCLDHINPDIEDGIELALKKSNPLVAA